MDTAEPTTTHRESHRSPRRLRLARPGRRAGQAIVEFALVGMACFMLTLATIDAGRAMYQYHQLTNAVREGARAGTMAPPDETSIKDHFIRHAPALGLTYDDIEAPGCTDGCGDAGSEVTVTDHKDFRPLLGGMFGWAGDVSITLSSSATAGTG